jgi:prevent-host-death family protein
MRTATITDAKNGLSALIDRVKSGESILILDRGVPVARMEPVAASSDPSGRIRRLERAGIVRPGASAPPLDLLRKAAPAVAPGANAVATLLEERRTGR